MTKPTLGSVARVGCSGWSGLVCKRGRQKVAHRGGGFRVEAVISWYGKVRHAVSQSVSRSVRRAGAIVKGSNGIQGMRCGSKVGLWHFGFGPWPVVDARSSLRGHGEDCKNCQGWALLERERYLGYLRTGTRDWWRDLRQCEWVQQQQVLYLGTSRCIMYLWPAKKRSVTRTDWDKRGRYTEPSALLLTSFISFPLLPSCPPPPPRRLASAAEAAPSCVCLGALALPCLCLVPCVLSPASS